MRVRMLFNATGQIDGHSSPHTGQEIEVEDVIGAALVKKGQAEVVAVPVAERAEKRPARKSRSEKRG